MNIIDERNSSDLSGTEDIPESTEAKSKKKSFFCPLSTLFLTADTLIKENEKCHNLRKHDISITEAKNYLLQVLNIISLETLNQQTSLEYTQPVVSKNKSKISVSKAVIEILHHSLFSSAAIKALSEKILIPSRAFALTKKIPPPMHIFPYEILVHHCLPYLLPFIIRDDIMKGKILSRLVLFNIESPKGKIFRSEAKKEKHFEKLLQPETQFMDLRDLQRKYFKGILTWKGRSPELFKEMPIIHEKKFIPEMLSWDYKPVFN
ncbi:uncharacterized protein LOC141495371 [Macrotis lagotis]|uniref:uncharacterized protein LOC141495371 n=1 Tax=Macrotis lagotis TaxID=92651 RepID=UPI003D682582